MGVQVGERSLGGHVPPSSSAARVLVSAAPFPWSAPPVGVLHKWCTACGGNYSPVIRTLAHRWLRRGGEEAEEAGDPGGPEGPARPRDRCRDGPAAPLRAAREEVPAGASRRAGPGLPSAGPTGSPGSRG